MMISPFTGFAGYSAGASLQSNSAQVAATGGQLDGLRSQIADDIKRTFSVFA